MTSEERDESENPLADDLNIGGAKSEDNAAEDRADNAAEIFEALGISETEKPQVSRQTENTEEKIHAGGFFDSLIADFSLDEIPLPAHNENILPEDDEVPVEIVDGITIESLIPETEEADTDPVVIYDENEDNGEDDEPYEPSPHYGFFRSLFPVKGDSIAEVIRKIVFLAAVITFIVAGVLLILNLTQSKQAVEDQKKDEEIIVTTIATTVNEEGEVVTVLPTREEILAHNFSVMEYYKDINPEIIGFLELPGCGIAQPITQCGDNDYYLRHTYYNASNQAGSVFADYRCTVSEEYTSPNIVLYGHNQRDGTMFGNLKEYKQNLAFYRDNPFVTFNTEYSSDKYVIFAFFITNTLASQDSNKEVFHYQDYIETLADEYTYEWYLKEIAERNQIIPPVDVVHGDRLLVLSTCSNEYVNSRFVVIARLLREDETEDSFDFSKAAINYSAKAIDWNAIYSRATTVTSSETETESETTSVPEETERTPKTRRRVTSVSETEETTKKKKKKKKETETSVCETAPPESEEETSQTAETTVSETEETTAASTTETTTTVTTTTTTPAPSETEAPKSSESSSHASEAPSHDSGQNKKGQASEGQEGSGS